MGGGCAYSFGHIPKGRTNGSRGGSKEGWGEGTGTVPYRRGRSSGRCQTLFISGKYCSHVIIRIDPVLYVMTNKASKKVIAFF